MRKEKKGGKGRKGWEEEKVEVSPGKEEKKIKLPYLI
jgi:hypothetical protein